MSSTKKTAILSWIKLFWIHSTDRRRTFFMLTVLIEKEYSWDGEEYG
jgi:hypothetical protein